jgi:hypothetical protein
MPSIFTASPPQVPGKTEKIGAPERAMPIAPPRQVTLIICSVGASVGCSGTGYRWSEIWNCVFACAALGFMVRMAWFGQKLVLMMRLLPSTLKAILAELPSRAHAAPDVGAGGAPGGRGPLCMGGCPNTELRRSNDDSSARTRRAIGGGCVRLD